MTEQTKNTDEKVKKGMGWVADKLLKVTKSGAKKLEDYATKSAKENNNDNAKKLADVMKKFNQRIDDNHDKYVSKVEENAEELMAKGQQAINKAKGVFSELKTRVEVARKKASTDSEKVAEEPKEWKSSAEEEAALEIPTVPEKKTEKKHKTEKKEEAIALPQENNPGAIDLDAPYEETPKEE